MCELMGVSASGLIGHGEVLRAFAARDEENADGWGLAWYDGPALSVVKEPTRWRASGLAEFLGRYDRLRTETLIAHVREGTTGGAAKLSDTHPFIREFGGRELAFAHNGTLDLAGLPVPDSGPRPVGGTDSEAYYCRLLGDLARDRIALDDPSAWGWVHDQLARANRRGSLNCLLADGRTIFVHHDQGGWKGLWLQVRSVANPGAAGPEPTPIAVAIVATRPLGGLGWLPLQRGETLALRHGAVVASSHRDISTTESARIAV